MKMKKCLKVLLIVLAVALVGAAAYHFCPCCKKECGESECNCCAKFKALLEKLCPCKE